MAAQLISSTFFSSRCETRQWQEKKRKKKRKRKSEKHRWLFIFYFVGFFFSFYRKTWRPVRRVFIAIPTHNSMPHNLGCHRFEKSYKKSNTLFFFCKRGRKKTVVKPKGSSSNLSSSKRLEGGIKRLSTSSRKSRLKVHDDAALRTLSPSNNSFSVFRSNFKEETLLFW